MQQMVSPECPREAGIHVDVRSRSASLSKVPHQADGPGSASVRVSRRRASAVQLRPGAKVGPAGWTEKNPGRKVDGR